MVIIPVILMTCLFNVWFQKVSILPKWKVTGNSWGTEVLKAKLLEGKYEAKLEFPGGAKQ